MEPMISKLDFNQHQQIEFAAPDRLSGVLAAIEYLDGKTRSIRASTIVSALILPGIALAVGMIAWAMR